MVKSIDWNNPIIWDDPYHIVKTNPADAKEMCNKFEEFNSNGLGFMSEQALEYVSKTKNIRLGQAEILSTYVVGLHCPDIK